MSDLPPPYEPYHRARRQLALWSAVLLVTQVVGLNLREIRGTVGNLVQGLAAPDAVDECIVILVLYFVFRSYVEWNQSPIVRRELSMARVDYVASLAIAALALSWYTGQAFLGRPIYGSIRVSQRYFGAFRCLSWVI